MQITKLKIIALTLLLLGSLCFAGAWSATVSAQSLKSDACAGLKSLDGTTACGTGEGERSVRDLVRAIISILSIIVGVVAVIMIIIAGFRYVTSGGDSNNVTSAKNTLVYALVGLIIVALAQFIVRFVLTQASAQPPSQCINCQVPGHVQ